MANEDKKDFNAMLHDNKDMPKFQIITYEKSIEKYGGNRMYFAPPIAYDEVMKKIPYGKVITVGKIREFFAKENGADFTEPITAGIFVSIAAWASHQRLEDKTPYWRTLKANGELNEKYKLSGRPDRSDSHQLLSYVLLTGADRCGFVLPGEKTEVKEMVSTGDNYLPLAPRILRYYELLLGSKSDSSELQKVLQ